MGRLNGYKTGSSDDFNKMLAAPNLVISGDVSSLPLGSLALKDKADVEHKAQAARIGVGVVVL